MRLPSVETLGCTTIICSDKTGTLTTNEMTVTTFLTTDESGSNLRSFKVTGHSFDPEGEVLGLEPKHFDEVLKQFALTADLCNSSSLEKKEGGRYKVTGMATEAALRVLIEKLKKADKKGFFDFSSYKKIVNLEFSSSRKSMSVICSGKAGNVLYVKGAPEKIIDRASSVLVNGKSQNMTGQTKQKVLEACQKLSEEGLRCLALAYKTNLSELNDYNGPSHKAHSLLENHENFEGIESGLTFLGVAAMRDPPRPEVPDAIRLCKQAGIKVFMITGDNQKTAEAIAGQVKIMDGKTLSLTGPELDKLSDDSLKAKLASAESCVFSRTTPENKYRLVNLLKSLNEVVAMTGDGVNDAPALKAASIGVAMGITGTEVAKNASDMVLADDKFSTIVAAVEEGRSIYNNTKAFIRYLISSNIGEVVSIFLTAMLGLPEGFTSVQLLWVNLVTDGPPATALGFNPPDLDIMKTPPRKNDEQLINGWVYFRYFVIGIYVGAATVGIFVYWYLFFESPDGHPLISYAQLSNWSECPSWKGFSLANWGGLNLEKNPCLYFTEGKVKASTLSLSVLVTIEMFNAFNALSEDNSLLQMPPWINPWLLVATASSMILHCMILYVPFFNGIFGIQPLNQSEWVLVLAFSAPVTVIDEVLKLVSRTLNSNRIAASKKTN
jgi:Ca2+-transporting ATPase